MKYIEIAKMMMLFWQFFILITTVQMLSRKSRRSLQMKKIIAIAPFILCIATAYHNSRKGCLPGHPNVTKKTVEDILKFVHKKVQ